DEDLEDREDVLLAQRANRVRALDAEARVHLHAADGREVVTLLVEEQALEQRLRRLERRRLAGTHDTVDLDERVLAARVLVGLERVADVGPDRQVVDMQGRNRRDSGLLERLE